MSICLDLSTQCLVVCKCELICACGCWCASWSAPLRGGVLAVEWVLELDDMAVPLTQEILLFSVILHQLGQRGKLLASVQVVVVARVLDLNVGHLIVTPEREKPQWEFNHSVSYHACKQKWTHSKEALSIFLFVFLSCSLAPCRYLNSEHTNSHPHTCSCSICSH